MPKTTVPDVWTTQLHSSLDSEIRRMVKTGQAENAWDAWADSVATLGESCGLSDYISGNGAGSRPRKDEADVFSLDDAERILDFARRHILEIKTAEPEKWIEECEMLLGIARDAAAISPDEHPLLHQMLAGELGWMLGLILGDWKPARETLAPAKKSFSEGIDRILDEGGLPKSGHLYQLRGLIACWTRVLDLGNSLGTSPWKTLAQKHFEWAILQGLRLTRCDGTAVFSQPGLGLLSDEEKREVVGFCATIEKALTYDTDPNDGLVALAVLPGKRTIAGKRREDVADRPLPDPAHHSDRASLTVMRENWPHENPALFVSYGDCGAAKPGNEAEPFGGWSDRTVRIELNLKSQTLWSGEWNLSVRMNDRVLKPLISAEGRPEPWTVNCDILEPEHAYLEIELPLEDGWLVQRHILFAYEEKIVLLADSLVRLVPPKDGETFKIEYESSIPLAPGIKAESDHEAWEMLLSVNNSPKSKSSTTKPFGRVFPLGLPEWKKLESNGEFLAEGRSLRLRMHGEGNGLFAPLVIDLDSLRLKSPYTWRRLTVGENLEVVPAEKAVGFRLQLAKEQFLLYRSLTSTANRTVLGHNLISDFLFAGFDPETGVAPIVDIEENLES